MRCCFIKNFLNLLSLVLWTHDASKLVFKLQVFITIDEKTIINSIEDINLAFDQGISVGREDHSVVWIKIETIIVIIYEESFLIEIVCKKKASSEHFYAVARVQNEKFLLYCICILHYDIAMDIDVGHDDAFFLASQKWSNAYNVIMEQLHTISNLLCSSLKIKQLTVEHVKPISVLIGNE